MRCRLIARLLGFVALSVCGSPAGLAADLTVHVDASDPSRGRTHSEMTLAARPGPLTLVTAKWMPGEHSPSGPLDLMIGLEIRANGQKLAWTRDPLDMNALNIEVPPGADRIEVSMDAALQTEEGYSEGASSTEQLLFLFWNERLLFPKGIDAEKYTAAATLRVPAGWAAASGAEFKALPDGTLQFEELPLARLIDSPVQVGRHTKIIDVPGSAPRPELQHRLSLAADSAAALAVPADFSAGCGRLVAEAGALFGSRMYRHYTWLLTLSNHVAVYGLEHHESSDNRRAEFALLDEDLRKDTATLLAHEYVHSWNGKYRRPAGLLSPDYQKPMDGTLLWVYEGLTEYWGDVLATRAALMSPEDYRELIASYAATFAIQPGSRWRPMADTAVASQVVFGAPTAWESSRRGADYYDVSDFLWMDVDAQLRTLSKGRLTLDDFARRFYAGESGAPALKPYEEGDVYAALEAVAPYDWRSFVHRHLDALDSNALLGALAHAGWAIEYTPKPNTWVEIAHKRHKTVDRRWSIGLVLDEDGAVEDVIADRAAGIAGVAPGMKVVAVNGRKYTDDVLDAAIADAQASRQPIDLLVSSGEFYRAIPVAYYDGPRFPHLKRVEGRPDYLAAILAARVTKAATSRGEGK
jgi:predicted metalloprotease with PDZ domain